MQISCFKDTEFLQNLLKTQTLYTLNEKDKMMVANTMNSYSLFELLESVSQPHTSFINIPSILFSLFEDRIETEFPSVNAKRSEGGLMVSCLDKEELGKCENLLAKMVRREVILSKQQIDFLTTNKEEIKKRVKSAVFGLLMDKLFVASFDENSANQVIRSVLDCRLCAQEEKSKEETTEKESRKEKFVFESQERKVEYQKYGGCNLYIGNLDASVDKKKLNELFSSFGTVTSSKILLNEKGAPRGSALVCLTSSEEAQKAVKHMNGKLVESKRLHVDIALEKRKVHVQPARMYKERGSEGRTNYLPTIPPFGASQNQTHVNRGFHPSSAPQNISYRREETSGGLYTNSGNPRKERRRWWKAPQGRNDLQQFNPNSVHPPHRGPFSPLENPRVPLTHPLPLTSEPPTKPPSHEDLLERKKFLGDQIFPKIESCLRANPQTHFRDAAKITGMLLESLDVDELVNVNQDPKILHQTIVEALNVLKECTMGGKEGGEGHIVKEEENEEEGLGK